MFLSSTMARGDDALETINAAATAIASVQARGDRAAVQKRWGSCFSISWCFGLNKSKRVGSAVIVPDALFTNSDSGVARNASQSPSIVLPFVAPPSSPASFLPSETPSVVQSPTAMLSKINISIGMFSPSCTPSIFAIGPYAHETQLVSPPVFSSFPTEPSTAPYTPPPESVHLTTPSSPEVPFAQLLEPTLPNDETCQRYQFSHYEFQYYQLQPGSPVSHLISPCSGVSYSGTSSPFHDLFLKDSRSAYPPKLLDLEKIVLREWGSHPNSTVVTPRAALNLQSDTRVSFDMRVEDSVTPTEENNTAERVEEEENEAVISYDKSKFPDVNSPSNEELKNSQNKRAMTVGSSKEFIFDSVDGVKSDEPQISTSVWWTNETSVAEDVIPCKNWPFFPSGVS